MSDLERMKELVEQLDAAARAYYQESKELMSNKEYDELYDELAALEKKTGTVLAKSPTAHAGYEVLSALPKENHPSPMLSLDKTKEVSQLQEFLKDQTGILSWKLDGLTIVLTYENGTLTKAVTRGNGITGEVVTQNARQFENLPAKIPFKGRLVLRGEAVISYKDFERINEENPDADAKYKNPRNLCAGSVRQLNSQVTAGRHVQFIAFALVSAEDTTFNNSRRCQFEWLAAQGFDGHIRHERHGGRAEGGHGDEDDEQHRKEQDHRRGVLLCALPGVGLPRGHDEVDVVGVGDVSAVLLDFGRDCRKLFLCKAFRERIIQTVGGFERRVLFRVVQGAERRWIVDGGNLRQVFELPVVHKGEQHQRDCRHDRAKEDEGRAPAHAAFAAVRQRAEQRQQKQRQYVVHRHDDAGAGLRHAELIHKNFGNNRIVSLPEGRNEEKSKADEDGALIVQLHMVVAPSIAGKSI